VTDDPDDDRTATTFVRGLTLGALLGAAVAGSSLWTRRRRARRAAAEGATAAPGTDADRISIDVADPVSDAASGSAEDGPDPTPA
jgi:hypothetical protein